MKTIGVKLCKHIEVVTEFESHTKIELEMRFLYASRFSALEFILLSVSACTLSFHIEIRLIFGNLLFINDCKNDLVPIPFLWTTPGPHIS